MSGVQRILRSSVACVGPDETIAEARDRLVEFSAPGDEPAIYYLYVTEGDELVGVASLRELLTVDEDRSVSDVMRTDVVSVNHDDPLHRVIETFTEHGLSVVPVVETDGGFVGVVRATDVIDALDEETTKQVFKQAGLWLD